MRQEKFMHLLNTGSVIFRPILGPTYMIARPAPITGKRRTSDECGKKWPSEKARAMPKNNGANMADTRIAK